MQSTQASSSIQRGAIPSLDGIRAIAVALVFFAHTGLEKAIPGGLGVTVFFVLSGYLISTLLRTEHATYGRIDYRGFYLRRFFRLIPPLAAVVLLVSFLALFGAIEPFTPNGLMSVLFYYGNYFVIAHDFADLPAGLNVVWSLAVEEHYYLLYPPLAALLLRVGRVGVSASALFGLCALVPGWRCWLAWHGVSETYITMASDTRIDAILVGCILALWRNPWLDPPPTHNARRDAAFIAASLGLLLFTLLYRNEFFRLTLRYTLQSVAVAVLLYFAVARSRTVPFRWLNSKPLVYIGAISYSVYLSHHVILQLLARYWPHWHWLATTAIAAALTLAVAEFMRRGIEQPCAELRKRLHKHPSARETAQVIPQPIPGGSL